jgi:CRP-like cAMP-binding protein
MLNGVTDMAVSLPYAIPEEELLPLREAGQRRRYDQGDVVFNEGEVGDRLHLIERGTFAVRVSTEDGDIATLRVLQPGEVFGELALIPPRTFRTATVVSLETGETSSVDRATFARLVHEHPGMKDLLLSMLASSISRLDGLLLEALYVPAETRVLRRLLDLADIYTADTREIAVPTTQQDLATMAGTSRGTVNRILREEERAGTVRLTRGRVVIVEPAELSKRAR